MRNPHTSDPSSLAQIDAIGGARFDDGAGGDNEVQRTMLEIVNQLDGFDSRGNIKVLMATNRPDTLDPALLRPGRLDRKVASSPHCVNLPDRSSLAACVQEFIGVCSKHRENMLTRLVPQWFATACFT